MRNPSLFFISFFHPLTYRETPMETTIRAHIYTSEEVSFCQVSIFAKLVWQNVKANFVVLPKSDEYQVGLPKF
jgi:hypothetical protein